MKQLVTEKSVKALYQTVISVPYCRLDRLVGHLTPIAYTANNSGWKADIYAINGVAIVTGYKPFGNYKSTKALEQKYCNMADDVWKKYNMAYEIKLEALYNLIKQYIAEVIR